MADSLVMIIRHAEKPLAEGPDLGVDELGQADDKSLIVRGWQRAGALAHLFFDPPPSLQVPVAIVASAPIKRDGSGLRSLRPTQTVAPLARRLQLDPDTTFSKGQEDLAGPAVRRHPSPVLVCWQHEAIPRLAAAIVESAAIAPAVWNDTDYDSIWLLTFSDADRRWTFQSEKQRLLAGDSP
ncbi:hypothetical protein ACWGS9_32005 [Bradyrhizobium sp. Arg314]